MLLVTETKGTCITTKDTTISRCNVLFIHKPLHLHLIMISNYTQCASLVSYKQNNNSYQIVCIIDHGLYVLLIMVIYYSLGPIWFLTFQTEGSARFLSLINYSFINCFSKKIFWIENLMFKFLFKKKLKNKLWNYILYTP